MIWKCPVCKKFRNEIEFLFPQRALKINEIDPYTTTLWRMAGFLHVDAYRILDHLYYFHGIVHYGSSEEKQFLLIDVREKVAGYGFLDKRASHIFCKLCNWSFPKYKYGEPDQVLASHVLFLCPKRDKWCKSTARKILKLASKYQKKMIDLHLETILKWEPNRTVVETAVKESGAGSLFVKMVVKEAYRRVNKYADGIKTRDKWLLREIRRIVDAVKTRLWLDGYRFYASLIPSPEEVYSKALKEGLLEEVRSVEKNIPYAYKRHGRWRGIKTTVSWKVVKPTEIL